MTNLQAVARALKISLDKATYILGAGGRDPGAPEPFTVKNGKLGSDCIGFVLWCLGLDRLQKSFPFYDGWINTDSMLMDVEGPESFFEEVAKPYPGCVVVYKSIWKDGKMIRMGHIGLVIEVPENWPESWKALTPAERRDWCKKVTVIDCAAAAARKIIGKAVGKRTAEIWSLDGSFCKLKSQVIEDHKEPEMASPKLGSRWLRAQNPMMRGQDVVELQKIVGIVPDGVFGPQTVTAVAMWQHAHGLKPDGVVGPATLAAMGANVG